MNKLYSTAEPLKACSCIGPQNGQPLCPCRMRDVQVINGRYVMPARDLGPAAKDVDGLDRVIDRIKRGGA